MSNLTKWLKITNQFSTSNEDEKPSHLLLNGYKLYVNNENIDLFNKKYAESLENKEKHYIVECKKEIFKLFFDLDFLLTQDKYDKIEENLNENENIFIKMIKIINDVVFDFYEKSYTCIVTTADIKKVKKIIKNEENPQNIDSTYLIKKGFHLHFADILVNKNIALEIRKNCLKRLSDFNTEFENSINDIVDEHVFLSSGLRMTGSHKGHFIAHSKEFEDEGRPYNLYITLQNNEIDTDYKKLLQDNMYDLINKTSIITSETNPMNIKNNPNLECDSDEENCNTQGNMENTGSWKRLHKDDIRYIEIMRFFNIYVKDYNIRDIKRIFYSENESIYILCSQSKYCTNIGRNHKSEHIYFKLDYQGICQKCFCRCDTLENRKFSYCKDYKSDYIGCTPALRKILNFKDLPVDKTKILKNNKNNNESMNMNVILDNVLDDMFGQFTNRLTLNTKKRNTKRK